MPANIAIRDNFIFKMIETPAPINATPAKYVQNKCPGIHDGTSIATKSA